jgi:hypothetical protein
VTDFKRDGDYIVEGTDIKAEYVGKDHNGHLHFLVDGVVCWMGDSGQVHGPDHIECKRIIERPKTHTITVYVYKSAKGEVFATTDKWEEKNMVMWTAFARFEKAITEGEGL